MFDVFHGRLFGPVLLIGVGVWLFVRRMIGTGLGLENDGTPMYRWRLGRALSSSFWVILTGFIWLLASLHILSWERSWPLYLIAAGVIMLFRRTLYPGYGYGYAPPAGPAAQPAAPVTTTSLVPADPHAEPGDTRPGRTVSHGQLSSSSSAVPPPGYDPREQRRYFRDQARAQRAAFRAQRDQFRYQMRVDAPRLRAGADSC